VQFDTRLGHVGRTRTNNGFFKLVEALLQTHRTVARKFSIGGFAFLRGTFAFVREGLTF